MMFWSVVYALIVGALGVAAAALLERVCRAWRLPVRWAWVAVIAVTVPLAVARVATDYVAFEPGLAAWITRSAVAGGGSAAWLAAAVEVVAPLDSALIAAWWCSIVLAAGVALRAWATVRRQRRGWHWGEVGSERVLLSPNVGPATMGFFSGAIVVPNWLPALPAEQRELVLAHEREHLRAWDHRVWMAALALLLTMPWNPFLWWQLLRLRRAIEMDCDLRVLSRRPGAAAGYARTLLDVSERTAAHAAFSLCFLSGSRLESRIGQLVRPAALSRIAAAATLAAAVIALAALLSIPNPVQLGCAARKVVTGVTTAVATPACSRVLARG